MIISRLSITNYRNIHQSDLLFSPNVNCFVGANGMGKSNVLDSIYHLSFCRGFASVQDVFNISHETDFFLLEGEYKSENNVTFCIVCSLKRGFRKRLKVEGKDVKRLSEHIGRIPLVMIAPTDAALVTGGSEERRRFMDTVIMQYNPKYIESLIRYDRSLKQRNALLKQEEEPDSNVLSVIEEMMSLDAQIIYTERKLFIKEFLPIFVELYQKLSGEESERINLTYASHGERGDLRVLLHDWRAKERIVGYTLHGVHKDELELTLNGYAVKKEASQGQQKTFFIAMKLAQYLFLKNRGNNQSPILLLDDIFDKLDSQRVARIIKYVSGNDFGQIFITDTHREHLDSILTETSHDYKLFEVENGEIKG